MALLLGVIFHRAFHPVLLPTLSSVLSWARLAVYRDTRDCSPLALLGSVEWRPRPGLGVATLGSANLITVPLLSGVFHSRASPHPVSFSPLSSGPLQTEAK